MKVALDDAVVMVTGASAGIGRAMVEALGNRPRVIVLVARRETRLTALAEQMSRLNTDVEYLVLPTDLSDSVQLAELVSNVEDRFGGVDVLINNAGMGHIGFFESTPLEKLETMMAVNVVALARLIRLVLPSMLSKGRGGILNVSSSFGFFPLPFFAAYPATKSFVTTLSEAIRCELAGTGVVMSQLSPGPVKTEFLEVAENPFPQFNSSIFEISAERCAQAGLRGLEQGTAVITPGFVAWLAFFGGALVPRCLVRWTLGPVMRYFRRVLKFGIRPNDR